MNIVCQPESQKRGANDLVERNGWREYSWNLPVYSSVWSFSILPEAPSAGGWGWKYTQDGYL